MKKGNPSKKREILWYVRYFVIMVVALTEVVLITSAAGAKEEAEASIAGTWNVTGRWEGYGTWDETWTIQQNGLIISGSSNGGYSSTGVILGPVVVWRIESGCFPIYQGTVRGDSMQGKMKCTTSELSGTWSATRLTRGSAQEGFDANDIDGTTE
jgi:hypothetical protein